MKKSFNTFLALKFCFWSERRITAAAQGQKLLMNAVVVGLLTVYHSASKMRKEVALNLVLRHSYELKPLHLIPAFVAAMGSIFLRAS